MKKRFLTLCFALALLFICSACEIKKEPQQDTQAERIVYEIQTDIYSDLGQKIIDCSLIDPESQYTKENDYPSNQAIQVEGDNYQLIYNQSIYYPDRDLKVHNYFVDAPKHMQDTEAYVQLLNNGTPYRYTNIILGTIDLSQVRTDSDLASKVAGVIAPYVDVTQYSECSVSNPSCYIIDWYDMIGDYKMPGGVNVVVSRTGVVWQIIITPSFAGTVEKDTLLSDSEILKIAQNRIEQSELSKLDSAIAKKVSNKYCVVYNDQFCQSCTIEVHYKTNDPETGRQYNNITQLQYIIPVE